MRKIYLSIDESIDHLVNNKNIDRTTITRQAFIEKPYLHLINPYTDLISCGRDTNGNHIYKENEDFEKFLECNRLDNAISNKLHCIISVFENKLKSFLMHKYCSKMKDAGDPLTSDYSWLNDYREGKQVFDLLTMNEQLFCGVCIQSTSEEQENREKVLTKIGEIVTEPASSSDYMIKHYRQTYGYVPFFVAIQKLSLGSLITLFPC